MLAALKKLDWSIYAISASSGVIMAGFMMLLPLLPRYAEQMDFNEFEIGLLVASFFIGRVLFQFPLGVISDRVGRRLVMSASLFLFTASTAAYALTTEAALMLSLRLLQGVASSGFVVGSQSYINDRTPPELRGLANGVTSSAINMGVIVGPLLGGTLSVAFTIQSPFWAGAALGAVCFFLSLAIPQAASRGEPAARSRLFPSLEGFRRILSPVFTGRALSLSLIQMSQMMGLVIFITAAPVLTAELLEWDSDDIALALALGGAAAAITSPLLGRLSDRFGRMQLVGAGLAVMGVQSLVVFLHPGTLITMAAFTLGGLGAPAYFNAFYALIGDVTRQEERGSVTGFVGSFGEWGSIIGGSLMAPLAWRWLGVDAPMALGAIVYFLTLLLALAVAPLLKRKAHAPRVF